MAKSAQLDAAIELFSQLTDVDDSQGAIEGMRRGFERLMDRFSVDQGVDFERVNAGGVAAEWVSAPGSDPGRVVVYVHGGGYVIGSVRTHRVLMGKLAKACGGRVLGLEYRLAPEYPFPAPIEDTLAAYQWLLSTGHDAARIAIAGDSAGGGLTVAAMIGIRYSGLPMPGAAFCLSPWVDMEGVGQSMTSKAEEDPVVGREMLEFMSGAYLAGRDPRAPLAAPIYGDLSGLPPTLVQVGSAETLLDDSTRLADRARAAGVDCELDVWEDMIHVWHLFAPILPEGQEAIGQAGAFIRKHTGG